MTDSRTGAGNTQSEHRVSCTARKAKSFGEKNYIKKTPMMGMCKRDTGII